MIRKVKSEKAPVFLDALKKLSRERSHVDDRKLLYCFDVFQSIIIDLTSIEKLLFNTLFARIAYLGLQYKLPGAIIYDLHLFRKEILDRHVFKTREEVFQLGLYLISRLLSEIYQIPVPDKISTKITKPNYEIQALKFETFYPSVRGLIVGYNEPGRYFEFISNESNGVAVRLYTDKLDQFQTTLHYIKKVLEAEKILIPLNIRDIGVTADGSYYPKSLVLDPDYLVDVTAVAECFTPNGARADYYLLSKMVPSGSSKHLILGHIVNFLLDELIHNPATSFDTLLASLFHIAPLEFCLLTDEEVLFVLNNVKSHYTNLVRVLTKDFPPLALRPADCIVEPSYYVPEYGLQGRLDVFYHKNNNEASIIELKSGSPFRENMYGLSNNHYTQTLLYDLMITAAYNKKIKPLNYILYSKLAESNIRFAPTIQTAQMEAISIRNEIMQIERSMLNSASSDELFSKLNPANFSNTFGFLKEHIEVFANVYSRLELCEKAYFLEFNSFIATEQHIAKTGLNSLRDSNGMANLWLNNIDKKLENFAIYTNLEIIKNDSAKEQPVIILRKTKQSNELAGFRPGDIVVLTPATNVNLAIRGQQVLRSTLIEMDKETFTIKLRSKQYNQYIFSSYELWNIEPDFLDSSFRKMFQALFEFSGSDKKKRDLMLGRVAPEPIPHVCNVPYYESMTQQQHAVLTKMLSSKDYFLLWGPPGTGKTSVLLKYAIRYYIEETDKKLMLMAYTNRAVDEICEVLDELEGILGVGYIRIGSRFSSGEKFRNHLLDNVISTHSTRAGLKAKLAESRIFVGTNSSIMGKMELFTLIKPDIAIVDEAAQILEPMLVGILPLFGKFIMIGDHRQLPAVVVQDPDFTAIQHSELKELGFADKSMSMFERLYKRCIKQGWDWAHGQLSEQGRMHQQIMHFVNKYFYEDSLQCLPGMEKLTIQVNDEDAYTSGAEPLDHYRMLFYPVKSDNAYMLAKHNPSEAEIIVYLVKKILFLHQRSGHEVNSETIGIITPFRAQIAQIRNSFKEHALDPDRFTIDTVERFQGGGRDIIIFSSVVNSLQRLNQIIDLDSEGLDRKLNVALTRTKKQFILTGNKNILSRNTLYRHLIENCFEVAGLVASNNQSL